MPKISVTVTAQQARLFEVLARGVHAESGQILLGLACEQLRGNPQDDAGVELMALCWQYSSGKSVPDAGHWLNDEEKRELGYDGALVVAAQ